MHAGLAGTEQQLHLAALLCVPLLWRRAPTLRAVAPQLVRSATAGLAFLPPRQLAAALADSSAPDSSTAFAAAAALGNLLEIAPVVLQVGPVGLVWVLLQIVHCIARTGGLERLHR